MLREGDEALTRVIDKHRIYLENAPEHIKIVFLSGHGDCNHCKGIGHREDGNCSFSKTYMLDNVPIEIGKAERGKFEVLRNELPQEIQDLYDKERTLHDGKWLLIRVGILADLEIVKQLILLKKKPNRKPFPKEQAVYSK